MPDDRKPKRQQVPTAPLVRQRRDSQSAGEGSREATAAGEQAAWIPPHSFASDIDGDRHIIVLADDADMDGWSVATTRGTWRLKPTTVWGSDSPNFLGIGTPARAWVAPCDHGELIRFLPPGA